MLVIKLNSHTNIIGTWTTDVFWLPRLPFPFDFFSWWIYLFSFPSYFFFSISLLCVFFVLFLISCMIHTYYFILSTALMLKSTKIYNPTFAVIKSSNFLFSILLMLRTQKSHAHSPSGPKKDLENSIMFHIELCWKKKVPKCLFFVLLGRMILTHPYPG